jgi:acetolactate synthase-1/2/3 large subunit
MIKTAQQYAFGQRYVDVDFPDFNFAKCGESFGCYGEVVTESNEIKNALERAKNSGKPAVIDIKMEYEVPLAMRLTQGALDL